VGKYQNIVQSLKQIAEADLPDNEILGAKNKELFLQEQTLKALRRQADVIKKAFKTD
jgi:hypothetical protein